MLSWWLICLIVLLLSWLVRVFMSEDMVDFLGWVCSLGVGCGSLFLGVVIERLFVFLLEVWVLWFDGFLVLLFLIGKLGESYLLRCFLCGGFGV